MYNIIVKNYTVDMAHSSNYSLKLHMNIGMQFCSLFLQLICLYLWPNYPFLFSSSVHTVFNYVFVCKVLLLCSVMSAVPVCCVV